MDRIAHKLVTLWMVATTAHLPFPVFDGDNVGSFGGPPSPVMSLADRFDIDFVLLGCDAPDDPDDGPVDDDPESGSFAGDPFPVFMGSAASRTRCHGKAAIEAPLPTPSLMQRHGRAFFLPAGISLSAIPPATGDPDAPRVMRC